MEVHHDIREVCSRCRPFLTMGTFDGVHRGHRAILDSLREDARENGVPSIVMVFEPHPRQVVDPAGAAEIRLLCTPEERIERIADSGIDHLVVMPFTHQLARLDYGNFVRDYLFGPLQMQRYYAGYDHGFGRNRKGGFEALKALGEELGFSVLKTEALIEGGKTLSSSLIRGTLEEGDVSGAARMLGYPYRVRGQVVYGNRIGHTIGYPTANIQIDHPQKMIPAMGVYAVEVKINREKFGGMLNIGFRPTIDLHSVTIEVHIFDFDRDIYGMEIDVCFLGRIREERRFGSLSELRAQLSRDQVSAKEVIGN